MTRHRAKTIRRQQQTLDAAMRIVLEEGPAQLTIARLAKEIGASVGGLYRYFPSKEALIFELQKQTIADFGAFQSALMGRVDAAVADRPECEAALARVAGAFVSYPAHHDHDRRKHGLLTAFLGAPKAVLSTEAALDIHHTIEPLLARCTASLTAATACGALSTGPQLQRTQALWAALHGLDQFRLRDRILPEEMKVPAILPLMLQTFLLGWGADVEAAGAAVDIAVGAATPGDG